MPRAKVVQSRVTFGAIRILAFIGGVMVGCFGAIPARLLFYAMLGNVDYKVTCSIASSFAGDCEAGLYQMFNLFSTVGRFVGIIFMVIKFSDMQDKFLHLQNLKVRHGKLYFKVRNYFFEPYSRQLDIFWSILYVLIETVIPYVAVFATWSIVFSVFYPFIRWFSLFFCLIGGIFAHSWFMTLVYVLLFPHRLEREVQEASLNHAVIETKEQEERALESGRGKFKLESEHEELD